MDTQGPRLKELLLSWDVAITTGVGHERAWRSMPKILILPPQIVTWPIELQWGREVWFSQEGRGKREAVNMRSN